MLASEIVGTILTELRARKGLDLEELIDDDVIYEELVDTLIERVQDVIKDTVNKYDG